MVRTRPLSASTTTTDPLYCPSDSTAARRMSRSSPSMLSPSVTNMDENGIWLSGTGPFSINNSTFDYAGSGAISTSTLITVSSVTSSVLTLTGNTYGNNGSAANRYNFTILGSSQGLNWTNQQYSGALILSTNSYNDKTGQYIHWSPVGCSTFTSVTSSSWSLSTTWDSGMVPTSCNAVYIVSGTTVTVDISSATASTTTITGQLSFSRVNNSTLTIVGGNVYVNAGGTLDMGQAPGIGLGPINASSASLVLAYDSSGGTI